MSHRKPVSIEKKQQDIVMQTLEMTKTHSGPLPPPEDLLKYNDACPDAANRIINMAEEQMHHRFGIEKIVINGDSKRAWAGLIIAAVIALVVFLGSFVLINNGHDIAGTVLVSIDLAAIIGIFIYGTNSRKNERNEKTKDI